MICNYCLREFEPKHFNQRLCSPECKRAAIKRAKENYKKTEAGKLSNDKWTKSERRKQNEKRYMKTNPNRRKSASLAYAKYLHSHPEAIEKKRILDHKRRCASGSFTREEWNKKLCEHGGKCAHCGSANHLTIDHIIPISRGGTNNIDNIQPLCAFCNSSKGGRYVG